MTTVTAAPICSMGTPSLDWESASALPVPVTSAPVVPSGTGALDWLVVFLTAFGASSVAPSTTIAGSSVDC